MAGVPVIRYSSNVGDYTLVDGIVVDEQRPPGGILGVPGNKVCCVGEFERGPVNVLTSFGSSGQFLKTMGGLGPDAAGAWYDGPLSLRGKSWGRLYVVRITNSTHAAATKDFADDGATPVLDITANSLGVWGNQLSAAIEAATSGVTEDFNLVITRNGSVVERHSDLNLADVADAEALPISSDYIVATRIELGTARPETATATALLTGSDGSFADSDYVGVPQTTVEGISVLYGDAASDIRWVFCGNQATSAINVALLLLATNGTTKNALLNGLQADTPVDAIADVSNYRSDRVGYGYPWANIFVAEAANNTGALVPVGPASFMANVLSAMEPGQNPAGPNGVPYLKGIRSLVNPNVTNANYEDFRTNKIMGLQFTAEAQNYEIRSGLNTSLDSALHNWARRTMADYIQISASEYLVSFRNVRINTKNKLEIKVALEDFLDYQIRQGILPNDSDLNDNRPPGTESLLPYIVDIANANSPEQEANGIFIVDLRVRIHATMDFLVFRTEIGERVEITEGGV
jgi:hypothetical protein